MEFRLVDATERDIPLIFSLIKALAEYEELSDAVVASEESLRESLFGRRAAETIIAYCGDEPAGFAMFFPTFSTFKGVPGMYLEDLYVVPKFRRHGLGTLFLQRLAQIAIERGYGRVEWSVLDWNELAIGFYKGLGAEPMDEWTVFRLNGESLQALARRGRRP